jgi:hypothetical protein
MAMGGMTMWVSSKTKSNSGAMLATVGALFVVLIVVPMMGGVVSSLSPELSRFLLYSNPFVLLYWAYTGAPTYTSYSTTAITGEPFQPYSYLWPTVIVMLLAAAAFLYFATENLRAISKGKVD